MSYKNKRTSTGKNKGRKTLKARLKINNTIRFQKNAK